MYVYSGPGQAIGDGHVNVLSCVWRWGEAAWHTEQSQQREKCDIKQTWNKSLIVCIFGFIFFPKSLTLPLRYVTGSGAGLSNSEISPLFSLSNPSTHSQLAFRTQNIDNLFLLSHRPCGQEMARKWSLWVGGMNPFDWAWSSVPIEGKGSAISCLQQLCYFCKFMRLFLF